jgi:hypothetical protein
MTPAEATAALLAVLLLAAVGTLVTRRIVAVIGGALDAQCARRKSAEAHRDLLQQKLDTTQSKLDRLEAGLRLLRGEPSQEKKK